MNAVRLEPEAQGRWRLSGELSYETVPSLAGRVTELFAGQDATEIDLGGVERADSAGVALLVEWMMEANRRRVAIRYVNMPAQMLAIARVSSLDDILPLGRA